MSAFASIVDKPRALRPMAKLEASELEIATAPKEEVWRSDMVRLYHYRPVVEAPARVPVLVVYALVGRYQMIDLESERSFVRKLLAQGLDVYVVDWGLPTRAQRWLSIDDYVNGYLSDCVNVICQRHRVESLNLLGICQGGVFCLCYSALHPKRVRSLVLTVTPIDFHGDLKDPQPGAGYMNSWTRALTHEDIDAMVEAVGSVPGALVGFSFLMMNPLSNFLKYTVDFVDLLADREKLLTFLRMERWIADRPDHPGEVLRQWFKDLYQDNKLVRNELRLGDRVVNLRAVKMPVLNIYAEGDVIIPPACTRGLRERFGSRDYTELGVPGGHIGTFVGAKAQAVLTPAIADWLKARM